MGAAVLITGMSASAVVILTAIWAAVRSGLRVRDSMRENTAATRANTSALADLVKVGGRMDSLEDRVTRLESRAGGRPGVGARAR